MAQTYHSRATCASTLVGLLLLTFTIQSCSYSILLFPLPWNEHVLPFLKIAEELDRRGHNVTILLGNGLLSYARNNLKQHESNISFVQYPLDLFKFEAGLRVAALFQGTISFDRVISALAAACRALLDDENTLTDLVSSHFDSLVVDNSGPCGWYLSRLLKVRRIDVDLQGPMAPPSLAYYGMMNPSASANVLAQRSSLLTWLNFLFVESPNVPVKWWAKNVSESPLGLQFARDYNISWSLAELAKDTSLVLKHHISSKASPFSGVQYLSPLVMDTPPSLPYDWDAWLGGGEYGTIYINLGTVLAFDAFVLQNLLKLLGNLQQRVILRVPQEILPNYKASSKTASLSFEYPPNVWPMSDPPHLDILSHANVIALFTHGGAQMLLESAYFGKPVLAVDFLPGEEKIIAEYASQGWVVPLPKDAMKDISNMTSILQSFLQNRDAFQAARNTSKKIQAADNGIIMAASWIEVAVKSFYGMTGSTSPPEPWFRVVMYHRVLLFGSAAIVCCVLLTLFILFLGWVHRLLWGAKKELASTTSSENIATNGDKGKSSTKSGQSPAKTGKTPVKAQVNKKED